MQAFTNAKAQIKKTGTDNNDTSTYTATVNIFDAQVTKKPNVLYIKIHIKKCSDNLNTILLFEVSALPYDKPVWQQLDKLNTDFKCWKN